MVSSPSGIWDKFWGDGGPVKLGFEWGLVYIGRGVTEKQVSGGTPLLSLSLSLSEEIVNYVEKNE